MHQSNRTRLSKIFEFRFGAISANGFHFPRLAKYENSKTCNGFLLKIVGTNHLWQEIYISMHLLPVNPYGLQMNKSNFRWPTVKSTPKTKSVVPTENFVCAKTDRKRFSKQIYLLTWPKNLLSQPISSVMSGKNSRLLRQRTKSVETTFRKIVFGRLKHKSNIPVAHQILFFGAAIDYNHF
jgi:hypothetical protein